MRERGENKDGPSEYYFLPRGEKARKPYPFPDTLECPHCHRTNGNIRRETFFRCWTCGLLIEKPIVTMPITDELKRAFQQKTMELVRCACGQRFTRMMFHESDLKDLCPVCRNRERSRQYKRERKGKGLFL